MSDEPTPYVRNPYVPKQTFIQKNWWLGFIAMLVLFAIIVALLYFTIRCHFKEAEQDRRRKEIEENNGEFIPTESASARPKINHNNEMHNDGSNAYANDNNSENLVQDFNSRTSNRSHGKRRGNPLYVEYTRPNYTFY